MEGLGAAAQLSGPFRHLGWPSSAALSLSSHGALPSCCSLPSCPYTRGSRELGVHVQRRGVCTG